MGQTWIFVVILLIMGFGALILAGGIAFAGYRLLGSRNPTQLPPPRPATKTVTPAPAAPRPLPPQKAPPPPPPLRKPGRSVHGDDELTFVTLMPKDLASALARPAGAKDDDTTEENDASGARPAAVPIIYDVEAADDQPTHAHAVILVAAVGQSDVGKRRKGNEDSYLSLDEHSLYVVADGMGGHAGGEVASQLAVDTIAQAFAQQKFEGEVYENVPKRGSELATAIQMANRAIFERAQKESELAGMGTTLVSARFTPGKERVYIGHVGDSRCYRFREGTLKQLTTDHTMGALGMAGPFADHLSRALGVAPAVKVDLVIAEPRHDDVFLLCSDGLSKMVPDQEIGRILAEARDADDAVKRLVERANERGGKDNITVIVVVVKDPIGFVRHVDAQHQKQAPKV